MLFHDDFSSSTWPGAWLPLDRPGDLGNQERQCYRSSNIQRNNGLVEILTQKDSSCSGYSYTSGMMQWRSFAFTYGTIEVRAKFPGGTGPWPAIWLLGSNCQTSNQTTADNVGSCSWPDPGSDEIDIAEPIGKTINQQIHSAGANPGCAPGFANLSQDFHTFGLIWSAGSARWTVDGSVTCTVTQNVPSRPMFLIINTAVGGIVGGAVDDSTLPQSFFIDEVTVKQ